MAVLAIDGAPFVINLAALNGAPSLARRFLAQLLDLWGIAGERAETGGLLVSELATNAVQATGRLGGPEAGVLGESVGSITVRALVTVLELRVEVFDRNPEMPVVQGCDADSESGRGLFLVDVLADAWGCEPVPAPLPHTGPGGKWVWFVLKLSSPPRPRGALPARVPLVADEVILSPRAEAPARPAPRPVPPLLAVPDGQREVFAPLPKRVRR